MNAENFVHISEGKVQGFTQTNYGTIINNYDGTAPGAENLTGEECRQRKVLLSKVKEYWIEGVLNKSLHTKAMIELRLEKRSDAVDLPFIGSEELPEESRQILPTGTYATEVFNPIGEGRTLLILGEPGAGKTITLLKLAQDLITRAEENESHLIPVVFNLSSWESKQKTIWGSKQKTIANWLVEELSSKYSVAKEVGGNWVEKEQLLLLLDGLDEVKEDRREACVKAINQFMQEHGQTGMVVCSRNKDYKVLSNRLQLRGAIYILSLTTEQVNQYLDAAGEQLEAVKTLLTKDTALQELAKFPLTLSIMTLAYQGKKVEELLQTGSVEERREHLFDVYIKRMFSHEKTGKPREYKSPYQNQQAKSWLIWLAQRMSQKSQSIFLIEQMQPSWLQNQNQERAYRIRTFMFSGLPSGLISGLISWVIFGPIFNYIDNPDTLWFHVLFGGMISALSFGIITCLPERILPLEKLSWTLKRAKSRFVSEAFIGFGWGLLILGVMLGRPFNWVFGTFGALLFCLWFALGSGLGGSEIEKRTVPNQGILTSLRNCILIMLFVGLISLLVSWLLFFNTYAAKMPLGLLYGLISALFFGLKYGGVACIQHFTLRQMLHKKGRIPWNYAHFLDYATDRLFLQKVGGGYIFVHRMLLEHFARMK